MSIYLISMRDSDFHRDGYYVQNCKTNFFPSSNQNQPKWKQNVRDINLNLNRFFSFSSELSSILNQQNPIFNAYIRDWV